MEITTYILLAASSLLSVLWLLMLASEWHTTYNYVNYMIFIISFLVLTVGNILAVKCLSRNSYKKEGR